MGRVILLIICSQLAYSASHATATYLEVSGGAAPAAYYIDGGGNVYGVYVIATLTGADGFRIIKSNAQGDTLITTDLAPDTSIDIVGIAAGANGNVVVAGNAVTTQNLPLISPLFPSATGPGFVIEGVANRIPSTIGYRGLRDSS